jgi:IclR helix-turn-helix domain
MRVARKKDLTRPKSNADHDADPRDGGVQSVDRALSIIETLAEDDEGYRLSDLAIRTGLSTSTVHCLLATLENRRSTTVLEAATALALVATLLLAPREASVGAYAPGRRQQAAAEEAWMSGAAGLTRKLSAQRPWP